MLYNIVLVSTIYQHESAIGIHVSPLSRTSFPPPTTSHPSRLPQSTEFELISSDDGQLGNFHALTIINSVIMNLGIHVSFSILVSSGYMPSNGIVGSYSSFIPSFSMNLHTSPCRLYQFTLPPTVQECSLFSTTSPALTVCRIFDDGHSEQCEMIFHCIFNLYFSKNGQC